MGNSRKTDPTSGQAQTAPARAELAAQWRATVESMWSRVADGTPPEGRAFLQRAVDQGGALFALAGAGDDGPDGDVLWSQPLQLWQEAAAGVLAAALPDAGDPRSEALRTYQNALLAYTDTIRGVGARTLADVVEAWPSRRACGGARTGLRELFDLYVELGERHYHELVSAPAFAEISGRLINALVACVAPRQGEVSSGSGEGGAHASRAGFSADAIPDVSALLAGLDLGIEQTLAELQAFGEKLDVGVATLGRVGAIDVGTSEKQAVHRDGKMTLYRYAPIADVTNPVPVLIVYALANRPYMMDLQPQRSLVRGLMERGLEVYLIDWGYPDDDDRQLDLERYVGGFIDDCVQVLCRRHGLDSVNLLGVCQGGTFGLCYSALNPQKVRNLVLMVTPVDFHTPENLLTAWLRHVDVDNLVDTLGNIPGALLNWAFISMKPLRLTSQKYLDMLDSLGDEEKARTFLRMEKWIHDSPDQAGECFRQFVKDLYQQNKLIKGELQIGDRTIDLQRITMPVLNLYASHDHIVPPSASLALEDLIATSDYTAWKFEGGHIGIYVSARAQQQVPQKIAEWLRARCPSGAQTSP
ncbi:MAG: class III poly(R)-hydroxyalkanoic acid synthase subunit PhaC [Gammaproteobacteria bacterium]|nr:class III poly(R)-hydroxyalkanoic acid synthase subunit PhaC [Gammaproteobacteria bacterium]NIP87841.1 class III poly(R)-hydroxyalkanoic acid synthase subunit PhaC [Gammaproteobacteria bacterium]NIR22395.1 class III poly(R)-hydroxyalkanoic acid synthase subunit PhaC [Gammaproteobacteria bacterium]NIS03967.1 class III poly(R)-hydroxyalkanoic acid synthase subunit PhaC [Gammaproteobacteria bacterium]NIV45909.1 class III poly(R)-hydroxyalkanoic acid synthase subunit PhaC [Gammaproteobacteria ba